ncbi:SWI SNF, matrix associated, actin dependent regulator of chromatin, sub b, member 1 [Borealophlyctis nickersoniae]|nr:SWI SNF, matrix associated, actin dependent regulator of chromatin, sub b, member 1 [Borealophlyctis nickersoniae]
MAQVAGTFHYPPPMSGGFPVAGQPPLAADQAQFYAQTQKFLQQLMHTSRSAPEKPMSAIVSTPPSKTHNRSTPRTKQTPAQMVPNVKLNPPAPPPPPNRYAIRVRRGESALLQPVVVGKRKRRGFAETDSEDESYSDDSDSEGPKVRRSRRNPPGVNAVAPAEASALPGLQGGDTVKATQSNIKQTKHDYGGLWRGKSHVATMPEVLVPIRLNIDMDGFLLRDTFTWNLNEPSITPNSFAEYLCEDLSLPTAVYVPQITTSIRDQIEEYRSFYLDSDFPVAEDNRTVIKLDLHVGEVHLRDRFEWDLASPMTPEEFARLLVADLGLGGEFATIIAHSIREQLHTTRTALLEDETALSGGIRRGLRDEREASNWCPSLSKVDEEELERIAQQRERNVRANNYQSMNCELGVAAIAMYVCYGAVLRPVDRN